MFFWKGITKESAVLVSAPLWCIRSASSFLKFLHVSFYVSNTRSWIPLSWRTGVEIVMTVFQLKEGNQGLVLLLFLLAEILYCASHPRSCWLKWLQAPFVPSQFWGTSCSPAQFRKPWCGSGAVQITAACPGCLCAAALPGICRVAVPPLMCPS